MLQHVLTGFAIFNLILLNNPVQSHGDYYWRDWNGTAPSDAFVAGTNQNQPIYIIQGLVIGYGLYVGYVIEGQTAVTLYFGTAGDAHQSITDFKVLCANDEDLYWTLLDSDNRDTIFEYQLPLYGGIRNSEDRKGIPVGRVRRNDNTFVGGMYFEDWRMYFVDELEEEQRWSSDEFEILLTNVSYYKI